MSSSALSAISTRPLSCLLLLGLLAQAQAQDTVGVTGTVEGMAGTTIGTITVNTPGTHERIEAAFTFADGKAYLDDWYDFRWVNLVTGYTIDGVQQVDGNGDPIAPGLGKLPAVDPQTTDGPEPFYYNAAEWASGMFGNNTVHVEGMKSVFADSRAGHAAKTVITFDCFLVAHDITATAGPGIPFCVLAGFRWTYTQDTNQAAFVQSLAGGAATINTALANAVPAFSPVWSATATCDLSACLTCSIGDQGFQPGQTKPVACSFLNLGTNDRTVQWTITGRGAGYTCVPSAGSTLVPAGQLVAVPLMVTCNVAGDATLTLSCVSPPCSDTGQMTCEQVAECFFVFGSTPLEHTIGADDMLLLLPTFLEPVSLPAGLPVYEIPDDPAFFGAHVYAQVYMFNPELHPDDPVKLSNGLDITLGARALPVAFGQASGLDLWAVEHTPLGGQVVLGFAVSSGPGPYAPIEPEAGSGGVAETQQGPSSVTHAPPYEPIVAPGD